MTDSKDTQESGTLDPTKDKKEESTTPILAKPPELKRVIRSGAFNLQTNLPPEIALATLPHISADERKMLIGEIAKENERMFEAYKINMDYQNTNSKRNKIFLGFIVIIFLILTMFLLVNGRDSLFEKILTLFFGAFGGGGTLVIYLYRKGYFSSQD